MSMDLGALVAELVVKNNQAKATLAQAEKDFQRYAGAANAANAQVTKSFAQAGKSLNSNLNGQLKKLAINAGAASQQSQGLAHGLWEAGKTAGSIWVLVKAVEGVATAVLGAAENAARFQDMEKLFTQSGKGLEDFRKATGGLVSDFKLIQQVNIADTMGITGDAFKQLALVARASAAKTGQSYEHMLESIVLGTARESRLLLDNLGIIVDVDKAKRDYVQTLREEGKLGDKAHLSNKKLAASLSDAGSKAAFMNAAMVAGQPVIEAWARAGADSAESFDRLKSSFANLGTALGSAVLDALEPVLGWLSGKVQGIADLLKEQGLSGLVNPYNLGAGLYGGHNFGGYNGVVSEEDTNRRSVMEARDSALARAQALGAAVQGGRSELEGELHAALADYEEFKALLEDMRRKPGGSAAAPAAKAPSSLFNPDDPKSGPKGPTQYDLWLRMQRGAEAVLESSEGYWERVAESEAALADLRADKASAAQAKLLSNHAVYMQALDEEKQKRIGLQSSALSGDVPQAVRSFIVAGGGDPDSLGSSALASVAGGGSILSAAGSMVGGLGGPGGMMVGGGVGAIADALASAVFAAIVKTQSGQKAMSAFDVAFGRMTELIFGPFASSINTVAGLLAMIAPTLDMTWIVADMVNQQFLLLAAVAAVLVGSFESMVNTMNLATVLNPLSSEEDVSRAKKSSARIAGSHADRQSYLEAFVSGKGAQWMSDYAGALLDNTESNEDNTEAVRDLTAEIRNLPQGYRVNRTRYGSETPRQTGGASNPFPASSGGWSNLLGGMNDFRRWV